VISVDVGRGVYGGCRVDVLVSTSEGWVIPGVKGDNGASSRGSVTSGDRGSFIDG
jgi:hypothetical protein